MTDQLHDRAWQQQEASDVPDVYEVRCDGCGLTALTYDLPELDGNEEDWYCLSCQMNQL